VLRNRDLAEVRAGLLRIACAARLKTDTHIRLDNINLVVKLLKGSGHLAFGIILDLCDLIKHKAPDRRA
jgi:hypothetical protein